MMEASNETSHYYDNGSGLVDRNDCCEQLKFNNQ
jgi:hypothetical protein